jgi:hypothetical protein
MDARTAHPADTSLRPMPELGVQPLAHGVPPGPAGIVPDGTSGGRKHGSGRRRWVAANDGVDVDALLEVRIEDRFAGRAPGPPAYLENQRFSMNSPDDVLF